jgi:hypothetical protein
MRRRSILLFAAATMYAEPKFFSDDPLMKELPPRNVVKASERKVSDYYDYFHHTFATPGELWEKSGKKIRARDINTLGEVPDGAWYANRHYFHPMTMEEILAGPGISQPPLMEEKWRVVQLKTEGITPGLRILDGRNRMYQIKFDPDSNPELSSAADIIGTKLFHALGYHVPQNYLVHFRRDQLVLARNAVIKDNQGKKRRMTGQDLADVIGNERRDKDGRYRAVASLFLEGSDLGPFRFYGVRADDPNDTVPHEHRRMLRGYRLFCAWVNHDDSRSINTIDMLVKEPGGQFIRHHLIDFGSILGSATNRSNSPRAGNEYVFNWQTPHKELFSLGLYMPRWARAKFPSYPSVGRFEWSVFDPVNWVPEYKNPAFLNMTDEDAFWAARQVMAFTDEQIRAVVRSAQYSDKRAEDWITQCLIKRRDKIGQAWLTRVLPLDRFAVRNGELVFEDLAATHKLWQPVKYQIHWARFDNESGSAYDLPGETTFKVPVSAGYLQASIAHPERKVSMRAWLRRLPDGWQVVGIERE